MTSPTRPGSTIVTLTMNPALDITMDTDRIIPTDKMRCGLPRYDPGGGGINVARIAHVLGASVLALFPAGGHAGNKVTDLVADSAVPVRPMGAGDAMTAGITVGLKRGWELDMAVRQGIAAGSAMLLTPGTAPCNRDDVERFFDMVADPISVDDDQSLSTQAMTAP
jgi:fructose-1-phosphate kinase PfkB-like protein